MLHSLQVPRIFINFFFVFCKKVVCTVLLTWQFHRAREESRALPTQLSCVLDFWLLR
jgi:hypothetical protein